MLTIRLARRGKKKKPFYYLVVAEKSQAVQKKFVAKLGHFNPLANEDGLVFDKDTVIKYIKNGAQLSQTVARMLTKAGVKEAGKFIEERITKPKKEVKKEELKEETLADKTPSAEESTPENPSKSEETPAETPTEDEANKKE